MHVDDFAQLSVEQSMSTETHTIDAIGPETFTYRDLVTRIGKIIGKQRSIMSVPPTLGHWVSWIAGKFVGDVIVTRDEIRGLMGDLLVTDSPPAGPTKLTEWAERNRETLGRKYASELRRRQDRQAIYFVEQEDA